MHTDLMVDLMVDYELMTGGPLHFITTLIEVMYLSYIELIIHRVNPERGCSGVLLHCLDVQSDTNQSFQRDVLVLCV